MAPADDYERAEAAYLEALRAGADPRQLGAAARGVSDAAREWAALAYREFFAIRETLGRESREVIEHKIQAEKAEMLQELWADISSAHGAYRGRWGEMGQRSGMSPEHGRRRAREPCFA